MADESSIAEEAVENGLYASHLYTEALKGFLEMVYKCDDSDPDSDRIGIISAGITELNRRLDALAHGVEALATAGDTVHALQLAAQMGLSIGGFGDDPSKLVIGALYLDTDDNDLIMRVESAFEALLDNLGVKVADYGPVKRGSWSRRFRLWLSDKEALDKAFATIEARQLAEPQSRVNVNNSAAIANLLQELGPVPNAAVHLGSLLLVKLTPEGGAPAIVSVELTVRQIDLLARNPQWMHEPHLLLDRLQGSQQSPKPFQSPPTNVELPPAS